MSPIAQALSAALIHFVWQGALVGVLLWVALAVLRHRSATMRYAVSCGALAVLVVVPAATAAAFILRAAPLDARAVWIVTNLHALVAPQPMLSIWMNPEAPSASWLAQVQLWALPVWSVGVLLFSVRLVWGCAHAFAVGRRGDPADEPILAIVRAVARRMGIGRPVRVLMSTLTDSPSVLGWLRPVLLLTPATAMGLTPMQLEAVIAHELAHIRRHDYLVNVFQVVAETLFFYHPAVWWTSSRIRLERELCCDDLAVQSCGDAVTYARALTTLEKLRVTMPSLAMGAASSPLLFRIQRLVGMKAEYGPSRWPGVLAVVISLACIALSLPRLRAQASAGGTDTPTFEVASVKQNRSGDGRTELGFQDGGRFTAINETLRRLIGEAYANSQPLPGFQIVGGPGWIGSDRFDVGAKAVDNVPRDQGRLMLRALLAVRFKLVVHYEKRERPIYTLTTARRDGRLGPQLRPSDVDCNALRAARRNAPATAPPPSGQTVPCVMRFGRGLLGANGMTMEELAGMGLSRSVGRVVVDRTGLAGVFDWKLEWTPDQSSQSQPDAFGTPPPIDPDRPSIFTALQEQLGLKLESQRGLAEILVIDRVERPSED